MMIQWAKKILIKRSGGGGGISASAPRPHGKSEASNTGKLIPVKRQPKNLKSSCPMMIEKVMIQRETCDAENAGSQGQKQTGKAEDAKSQSQKAASGTGNAEDAKERNCECRGCAMKGHKSYKNPRKSHKSQKATHPEKQK